MMIKKKMNKIFRNKKGIQSKCIHKLAILGKLIIQMSKLLTKTRILINNHRVKRRILKHYRKNNRNPLQ